MLYRFRVYNPEDPSFLREYEVPSGANFYQFHQFLQRDLQLEGVGVCSFYTTRNDDEYTPVLELTEIDMENDTSLPTLPMAQHRLEEFVHQHHEQFLYAYDILGERALLLEVSEVIDNLRAESHPGTIRCTHSQGERPRPGRDIVEQSLADIDTLLDDLLEDGARDLGLEGGVGLGLESPGPDPRQAP